MSIEPVHHRPLVVPLLSATVPPRPAPERAEEAPSSAVPEATEAPEARDAPTTEAMAAVQTAARAYEQLRANDRVLHFLSTDSGLRIEVYDGRGELVRRIPPNEALAIAAGEGGTWLA